MSDETRPGDRTSDELATLLAQIYAHPNDRGLREVYADALLSVGDPRGEFIALQLRGGHPDRERQLLDEHWRDWLYPIARCTDRHSIEFVDGFLDRVLIGRPEPDLNRLQWHRIQTSTSWSTVRRLSISDVATETAHPAQLARILEAAPLAQLVDLRARHHVLGAAERLDLRLNRLAVHLVDEPFGLDLGIARDGRVEIVRDSTRPYHPAADLQIARDGSIDFGAPRASTHDPADIAIWRLAAEADCAALAIANDEPPPRLHAAITNAIATDRRRPRSVSYDIRDHAIALDGHTLTIRIYHAHDTHRLAGYLRPFEHSLYRFETIRLGAGKAPLDTTVFEGNSDAARTWLAGQPS